MILGLAGSGGDECGGCGGGYVLAADESFIISCDHWIKCNHNDVYASIRLRMQS